MDEALTPEPDEAFLNAMHTVGIQSPVLSLRARAMLIYLFGWHTDKMPTLTELSLHFRSFNPKTQQYSMRGARKRALDAIEEIKARLDEVAASE